MVYQLFTYLAGALILLCFYVYLKFTYWRRNSIPTAKGYYPLFGHTLPLLLLRKSFAEVVRDAYNQHKGQSMVGIYKHLKPILIIREPNLVKTVMQTSFSSFHDNGFQLEEDVDYLLSKNPFFSYGETWLTGRKRLTYAFSSGRLKSLFVTISGVCKKFHDYLERRLKMSNKYEVDMKHLFSKFTGEVVANVGFGIEGHCYEDKETPNSFDRVGDSMFTPSRFEIFMTQFLLVFPDLNRLTKISLVPKHLDQLFRTIVAENLEIRRKESTPRNDFLQLMIELEKTGDKVDEGILAAHAFSFYADGFETSSITLSFAGYYLAMHQDVQERVREEVKSAIKNNGGVLTYEALKELKYMEQVISESQRLYPAIGVMSKLCTEEFLLEGSDGLKLRVKPGTEIIIPVAGLHHDEMYWPDPETFDPERFSDERKKDIEKMTFLPFGEGPRMCVGMRMAMVQMKACLATLLHNYKLELAPKTKIPLETTSIFFLTSPVGGLWVQISKL